MSIRMAPQNIKTTPPNYGRVLEEPLPPQALADGVGPSLDILHVIDGLHPNGSQGGVGARPTGTEEEQATSTHKQVGG